MPMLARALTALALSLILVSAPLSAPLAAKARKKAAPWRPVAAEILMDADSGKILRSRHADTPTYPASLAKMMTLLLTFEALDRGTLRLDQQLPVSRYATTMPPSRLSLAPGSTITVEEAILALVTRSANDVAVVLAEAIAGSEKAFGKRMTARARALGMKHTVFRNASGLPNREQRTTARDMAILSRALVTRHAKHYGYFSRRSFVWQGKTIYGHNRLLSRYEGMDGIKTGFINASGFNLAASAVRNGHRLIAVVMGGESAVKRDQRVGELLDAGFRAHTPLSPDAVVAADEDPASQGDAALGVRAALVTSKPASAPEPQGIWSVQVGAFKNARAARRSAAAAAKALGQLAAGSEPKAVRSGRMYKARLVGFQSRSATVACDALKAKHLECFTLRAR
ncbi:MAG TPA: D-alanyl-D-alanine carboxypeptidase family protein [Azospirillum sp.]|nr:D-alanyl-D-alanine carboxypeptidase family protein [Azospirillum sp.]